MAIATKSFPLGPAQEYKFQQPPQASSSRPFCRTLPAMPTSNRNPRLTTMPSTQPIIVNDLLKDEEGGATGTPVSDVKPRGPAPSASSATLNPVTPDGSPVLSPTLMSAKNSTLPVIYESPILPTSISLPESPTSPTSSTTSSISSDSPHTPCTPPSILRRARVHRGPGGEDRSWQTIDRLDGDPEPDTDTEFEGLLSSFAGWWLQSRPATPAPFSEKRCQYAPEGTLGFTRTVSAVKRQQDRIKKLVESLEQELAQVHDKVSDPLRVSTQLLMRTQDLIVNERKNMEKRHESTASDICALETKLNTAQRHIATLQAQHIADKGLIEQLN
ncbi:hypothetical protein ACG7TL_006133 [Trametes sanguinea]